MKKYGFNKSDVKQSGTLFDEAIETDPNVYFHGTDSVAHQEISIKGLAPHGSCVSRDEIATVCNIFDRMSWFGVDRGGYPVLKPFSHDFDHHGGRSSPLYLAETSLRASLYATRDFAGGEKVRAMRKSIRDLERYCEDEAIRNEHLHNLVQECENTGRNSSEMKPVDLTWLKGEVKTLSGVMEKCSALLKSYQHGVVYAIRPDDGILQRSERHHSMGLLVFETIPVIQIIAYTDIPTSFDPMTLSLMALEGKRRIFRPLAKNAQGTE